MRWPRAEARLGIIPKNRGQADRRCLRGGKFDIAALGEAAVASGNIAIPLVKALTAAVKKRDANAAGYVHWGATSQDIIDTALVLDLRAAIDVLVNDLDRAIAALFEDGDQASQDADRGAHVVAAGAADAVRTESGRLRSCAGALARPVKRLRDEALVLQFGGAAGTLAALGKRGLDVAEKLANELELPLPDAPGTAIATALVRSRAPSPFSPAPAEKSRAMSRS